MKKIYRVNCCKNKVDLEDWLNTFECPLEVLAFGVEGETEFQNECFWIVIKLNICQ